MCLYLYYSIYWVVTNINTNLFNIYLFILLQVSLSDTVRLNTRCSGVDSLSTLK